MTLSRKLIIAIDGPAASGKGSLAKKLAEYLGFDFLDTGALYRRVALKVIQNNVKSDDIAAIINCAKALSTNLDEKYDDSLLRNDDVGSMASIVAQIPEVRAYLIDFQRNFAKKAVKGAVLDGRDIGTVICPDADIKLFVTASLEKRAQRRHKELQSRGINATNASVLAEMQERDERDSVRLNEHLTPHNNAIVIDTSDMTPQEVFDEALNIIGHKP
ncbi:MAG: (d)CMP kinase [Alphaproteobacteria bacterium]|nr:(d)CMP kinase [Alphaproteobacteria bacterium]